MKQLQENLKKHRKEIEDAFSRDLQDGGLIRKKMEDFKAKQMKSLYEAMDELGYEAKRDINVILLGRYSHGKSALLNALFKLDESDSMPEGEGVVTSKETKVQFVEGSELSKVTAYKVLRSRDKEPEELSLAQLQALVGSKEEVDVSDVNYYNLVIPVTPGDMIAEEFCKRKVSIYDLPGIGSIYSIDDNRLKKYLDRADIILMPIKITEIKEAGILLKPFLDRVSVEVIPVLTYFDRCDTDDFADCNSNEEKLLRAKEILLNDTNFSKIKEHIPSIVAVSSLRGHEMNIQSVRDAIIRLVDTAGIAVDEDVFVTPIIQKRKNKKVKEKCDKLLKILKLTYGEFNKLVSDILPKSDGNNDIDIEYLWNSPEIQKKITRYKDNAQKSIEKAFRDLDKRIGRVRNVELDDVKNFFLDLEQVVEDKDAEVCRSLSVDFKKLKDDILAVVIDYIGTKQLTEISKKRLIKELREEFEELEIDFEDILTADFNDVINEAEKYTGFIAKIMSLLGKQESPRKIKSNINTKATNMLKVTGWIRNFEEQFSSNRLKQVAETVFSGVGALYKKDLQVVNEIENQFDESIESFNTWIEDVERDM